jgi:hypothetical protein
MVCTASSASDLRDTAIQVEILAWSPTEAVREICKQDGGELLEYQLGDGWEPLAAFFEMPVPDEPFPHPNEQKELRKV